MDWISVEKLDLQHNSLEQLPKAVMPRLRELTMKFNGPLFQMEESDETMFRDRWPLLQVGHHASLQIASKCLAMS